MTGLLTWWTGIVYSFGLSPNLIGNVREQEKKGISGFYFLLVFPSCRNLFRNIVSIGEGKRVFEIIMCFIGSPGVGFWVYWFS